MNKAIDALGFPLSNEGMFEEIDNRLKKKHPEWTDAQIRKRRRKILKKDGMMYSKENKRIRRKKRRKNNGDT